MNTGNYLDNLIDATTEIRDVLIDIGVNLSDGSLELSDYGRIIRNLQIVDLLNKIDFSPLGYDAVDIRHALNVIIKKANCQIAPENSGHYTSSKSMFTTRYGTGIPGRHWEGNELIDGSAYLVCSRLNHVTDYTHCSSLVYTPINGLNFNGCISLEKINITGKIDWSDTSGGAFEGCKSLEVVDNLDTSGVTDADSLFAWCDKLHTVCLLDFTNAESATAAFLECINLTNLGGLLNLKCNINFRDCKYLSKESMVNVIKYAARVDRQYMDFYDVGELTDEDIAIATSKGWIVSGKVN